MSSFAWMLRPICWILGHEWMPHFMAPRHASECMRCGAEKWARKGVPWR
jgi:hypothetical protein